MYALHQSRPLARRVVSHHRFSLLSSILCRSSQLQLSNVNTQKEDGGHTLSDSSSSTLSGLILLQVDGMKCGGCSAAVKRMLQSRPDVETAAVNLITGTAAIRVRGLEARNLAEEASAMLTSKGFPAKPRAASELEGDAAEIDDATLKKKEAESREAMFNLITAWTLATVSCAHHLGHLLHVFGLHQYAHAPALVAIGNPWLSGLLGAVALAGPGRSLMIDGYKSLWYGSSNMNSLVAVGCTTSFSAGAASCLLPSLSASQLFDASFLEEPVMLLAFVLLGRTLESRARATAASDLLSLAQLIPAQSRLVLDPTSNGLNKPIVQGGMVELLMVPTSTIQPGDVVQILPGEKVPVDGEVVEGSSAVDESALTGEPLHVPKIIGSRVTGGTISHEGVITVRAMATGKASTLAGIARLVSDAQSREAPAQRLADVVAGKFCYGVMAASAATFAFWSLYGVHAFPYAVEDATFTDPMMSWEAMSQAVQSSSLDTAASNSWWIYLLPSFPLLSDGRPLEDDLSSESTLGLLLSLKLAVDVLVVACPCALGLATPTAVLVASSMAARRGLLIRGGDVLERLAGVNTVVLDKTGTLTQGKLKMHSLESFVQKSSTEMDGLVLRLAAAAESVTRHPLAEAVVREAEERGVASNLPTASEGRTEPGAGVTAKVLLSEEETKVFVQALGLSSGQEENERMLLDVFVGRKEWVKERVFASESTREAAESWERDQPPGSSIVWIGALSNSNGMKEGSVIGSLALTDTLRSDAQWTVSELKRMGMQVYVMSGDNQRSVSHMAHLAGIEPQLAIGGLTPEGKMLRIEALKQEGAPSGSARGSRVVAMVGDGVNDTPALAASDVGIALKGGLDAAGEAALVVLMGDRLSQVVESIDLGRKTLGKIRQNLIWALMYNIVGIPLAAGALLPVAGVCLNPSMAAGMMAMSSVAVVSNSLLLRYNAIQNPLTKRRDLEAKN